MEKDRHGDSNVTSLTPPSPPKNVSQGEDIIYIIVIYIHVFIIQASILQPGHFIVTHLLFIMLFDCLIFEICKRILINIINMVAPQSKQL